MLIRVGSELEKLEAYAVGLEQQSILGAKEIERSPVKVAEFTNPVLLTDNARIARLPATTRDTLIALYQSYPRRVEYMNVGVDWAPHLYPRVWCPSIDTIFFAHTLCEFLTPKVRSFAEIGCGSGFLTKFMLEKLPIVEKAVATDINLEAIACTQENISNSPHRDKIHLALPNAHTNDLAIGETYDLVITNPPYIPRPDAVSNNPYEGLGLIANLARNAHRILLPEGKILVNISSLAGDEPLSWFEKQGLTVHSGPTLKVPLKVNPVTSGISQASRAWRDYLEKQNRVEIDESEQSGYRYWHYLRMFIISA